jgi:oxygen-dependent protoporphyrinogen oxidase
MKRVVVVGGGIAGLTTALHLIDRGADVADGLEVTVLEAAPRVGGNIRTDRQDGWTIEQGPNGYLDNVPATRQLVRRLGLEDRLQPANERAAKRYLYRHGRMHLLPTGPVRFLASPVLSKRGRLRVLMEPFANRAPHGADETIFEFASRRIGHEAASTLIDAMVSGVFAGDINRLSLSSTFPKMAEMEARHGGLVKAMLARMRERKAAKRRVAELKRKGEDVEDLTSPGGPAGPGGTLTSLDDGLDLLVTTLHEVLGDRIHLATKVEQVQRLSVKDSAHWRVTLGSGEDVPADALVLAVPAPYATPLFAGVDRDLHAATAELQSASLAVVALGFAEDSIGGPPEGFGFLVPRGEGPRILGCLWDSSLFPGRAPKGSVLMRLMIGGAHDPEAVTLDDDSLVQTVRADLATTMGVTALPVTTRIYRHHVGIGQYTVGHDGRLGRIHARLDELGHLWVAGSSYYGVSMNACIEKAGTQSDEIIRSLNRS